jgi:hypothetical protein
VVIIALTAWALLIFNIAAQPDIQRYRAFLPLVALPGTIMAGAGFAIINGTLEELVFRGVLFDAVQSQCGVGVALLGTAALFGLGHLHGYPPGLIGACLASFYGLLMGILRLWTRGLLLPIVAHIGADATIYALLVHASGT